MERADKTNDIKTLKKNKNFIPFSKPSISKSEIKETIHSLKSGWLISGAKVKTFEKKFATYKDEPNALALSSCTAALHLALLMSKITKGDEVITTPMTFCATVNVIIHVGAIPVLADIDPKTMNIDPEKVIEKITPKTKAVIVVHFAGRSCDMDRLKMICDAHKLLLIEDCAHAIESEFQKQKVGTIGDFGCFSFHATKNITTGEGGMLLAKDQTFLEKAHTLSNHGMNRHAWSRYKKTTFHYYDVEEAGYKYTMMDIQAALGIHQIEKLGAHQQQREKIWATYNEELANLPIEIPTPTREGDQHARHLYTILIDEKKTGISRNTFLQKMYECSIGLSVHYLSIPEHSYYQKKFSWQIDDFPRSKQVSQQTVSLPLYPGLTNKQLNYIIGCIKRFIR